MPIVDLQHRYRELGRIRLGQKQEKGYPTKLETFRLTSPEKRYIEMVADLFGGDVKPWKSPAGDQWEVVTKTKEIPVIVPAQDLTGSQYYELWGSPGENRSVTRLRRCDGVYESLSGEKCLCNPDDRDCSPVTHLQVIIPALPDIGIWRATSHSFNVAAELPASVHTLGTLMRFGAQVDAFLVTSPRSSVNAEGQRMRYNVLELRIPHTTEQLIAALPPDTDRGEFVAALTAGPSVEVAVGRPVLPPTPGAAALPAQVEPVSTPDEASPPSPTVEPPTEVEIVDQAQEVVEQFLDATEIPPDEEEEGAVVRDGSSLSVREKTLLELASLKGDQKRTGLLSLLEAVPAETDTKPVWERWIRLVFGLMEKLGYWKKGRSGDALHMVLSSKYQAEHLTGLRKDKLVELGKMTAVNAQAHIDNV